MISKSNLKELLKILGFTSKSNIHTKKFKEIDAYLKVDFKNEKLIYPENKGFKINEKQTCNFSQNENFVVFECVHRLFEKGYKPNHIELEPRWKVGHGASGGRADIMIKDNSGKSLLIIECKTEGREFDDAWKKTLINGGQLLSYVKQAGSTQFACLYTSDYLDEKIIPHYYLITLKDNKKLLEEKTADGETPLSYQKAKGLDVEDIFQAWKETYAQDYGTKGVFEEDISAYEIGKTKYSLKDLSSISSNDIQGKYHEFATILRQHNVSGRENAFDKLVNLFLCKIVDETNNPKELKFYWKGIAYDDQFSLIDRLQKLYQEGMQKFLDEDVVYISADQIDSAFEFFKNDPDATKDKIKQYFKELKFFNNNDFGFIDVHNKKLFYQNTAVLLKIVQMLQDIRLKSDVDSKEEHQFLGDMFEGFLDQGVKQSEGQFFTPMPIVKFILKSLPLESIITKGDEIPKVIDFACGAGHFLNEYAKEIKPIVEKEKEAQITDFYENIYGVEKEYRLSKVAKVSSFMYGQDDINIVYSDALSSGKVMDDKNIRDNSFSVLVANPPYSVKGFLETLEEIDRKKYELIKTVGEKRYPNNNSIETFFIERAKQLLKPGGVAGIIVPSSILTKGKAKSTSKSRNIYVATREILLKYFDIVAIAEFGSGTFGKTGTNTVTLFIRRKKENPAPADHFLNRVNAWFSFDKSKDGLFEDEHLLKKYCNLLEYDFVDYQTLLKGKPNETLLSTEVFNHYRIEFDKWTEIRNLKRKKVFKVLSNEEKTMEIKKRFLNYITESEKEKLYYFMLANENPQEVLVVKSPSKTAQMKAFLGYEWSAAKGNEGIKYLGGVRLDRLEGEDVDEGNVVLEEEDKRVLSNIFNLNNIVTPLYDPHRKNNSEKINHLINQNYQGENFKIPGTLGSFVNKFNLIDMLDFSRPSFDKSISLSPKKSIVIESVWGLKRIEEITSEIISGSRPDGGVSNIKSGALSLGGEHIHSTNGFLNLNSPKYVPVTFYEEAKKGRLLKNDVLICKDGALTGKIALVRNEIRGMKAMINEHVFILRCHNLSTQLYLFNFLFSKLGQELLKSNITGAAQGGLNSTNLKNIKVPFPPLEVQKKIIDSCASIDNETEKAQKTIVKEKQKIEKLIQDAYSYGSGHAKLNQVININMSTYDPSKENKEFTYVDIDSVQKGTGLISFNKKIIGRNAPSRARRIADLHSTIVSTVRPYLKGFAYIDNQPENTIYSTGFAILKSKDEGTLLNELIYYYFMFSDHLMSQMEAAMPKASYPSINREDIENFNIPILPINIQKRIVNVIEKSETKIKELLELIDKISTRKSEVIKAYLMGEPSNNYDEDNFSRAAETEIIYNRKT